MMAKSILLINSTPSSIFPNLTPQFPKIQTPCPGVTVWSCIPSSALLKSEPPFCTLSPSNTTSFVFLSSEMKIPCSMDTVCDKEEKQGCLIHNFTPITTTVIALYSHLKLLTCKRHLLHIFITPYERNI